MQSLGGGALSFIATELIATVQRLLEQSPGEPLCDPCLAFACSVSLTEMRAATAVLAASSHFVREPAFCGSCRRQTPTTAVRQSPAESKCVHCSRPLLDQEPFTVGRDVFHMSCWRMLVSDDKIRTSRMLSQNTREIIKTSRERLRRVDGSTPDIA